MSIRPDEDRELLCELTESELLGKGDALAAAVAKHEQIEAEKAEAMGLFKTRLEAVSASIKLHKAEIQSRKEARLVLCRWRRADRADRKTGLTRKVLELVRTDTEAVVETREVTSADMQEEMLLS